MLTLFINNLVAVLNVCDEWKKLNEEIRKEKGKVLLFYNYYFF